MNTLSVVFVLYQLAIANSQPLPKEILGVYTEHGDCVEAMLQEYEAKAELMSAVWVCKAEETGEGSID